MKVALITGLFVIALINISGCNSAQRKYDDYVASQNGLGGFIEGVADGYTGTTSFVESAQIREAELAANKNHTFNWACGTTVLAVIVTLVSKSKKGVR